MPCLPVGRLRCPVCEQAVDGLTLYLAPGHFRLMVCAACYRVLVAKEHQPHSKLMQRVRRLLWGVNEKEVVTHAGAPGDDEALGHRGSVVAQGQAQLQPVSVAEPGVGRVGYNTPVTRRKARCGS